MGIWYESFFHLAAHCYLDLCESSRGGVVGGRGGEGGWGWGVASISIRLVLVRLLALTGGEGGAACTTPRAQ